MFMDYNSKPNNDELRGVLKKLISLDVIKVEKNDLLLQPVKVNNVDWEKYARFLDRKIDSSCKTIISQLKSMIDSFKKDKLDIWTFDIDSKHSTIALRENEKEAYQTSSNIYAVCVAKEELSNDDETTWAVKLTNVHLKL